ncbi:MAG: Type site-specific deoxyribonuclease, partial [Firmicutes bacterium]|nr:Type site-specific deoxyribonuclease [Bacillota bacterium]
VEGISKRTISLEDQKRLILEGKEIEEINFEGSDLEKTVINKGTNALIVKEFMEESIKDGHGVLPGKTIFFCSSKSHARRLEQIFDALYPEYNGELAKVLVSDDPRVYGKGGLLDQFKNNDMPRIALSVDMLDTGIDIREVVNLVFAKPVYSYTKFWQMIGRGTRLLESNKIKPWCTHKDCFLILDCWDNFEYFKLNPKGKEATVQIPLPVRFVGIRIDKIAKAIELHNEAVAAKEMVKLVERIGELPLSVNIVARESVMIKQAQTNHYWATATEEKFDELAEKLSPLMKYCDDNERPAGPVKLDLLDVIKTKEMVEFGPEHSAVSVSQYREMVEQLILELTASNPVLQKIKAGNEISDAEAQELAALLHEQHPHITEDLLKTVYKNRKAKFMQFIRHILGLEVLESFPETVTKAFDQFIQSHTNLSARQLDFLMLLKDFILEKERVQKRDLIESPFTILHPQGIRGLFSPEEINEILELTNKVAA